MSATTEKKIGDMPNKWRCQRIRSDQRRTVDQYVESTAIGIHTLEQCTNLVVVGMIASDRDSFSSSRRDFLSNAVDRTR